jgi:SWI/SNF-related matrix-associated actin-dependent regulator 1 of chromatin subfamily A
VRSKNQSWLRERLGSVILRRTKAQVLPELPPLVAQDVPLVLPKPPAGTDQGVWRAGVLLWDRTRRLSDDQFLAELHQVTGSITTLRRELGLLKVAPAAEWIAERLACGTQKMLVFGWHVEVLERLHELLAAYAPVLVTGRTPPTARDTAVRLFQTHPQVRVFVGQILAAGTAITLTAASEVAIVEPSWVPGENRQAIDRAHRLGQRDSVLASFLHIPGTLDHRIMTVFRRKAVEIAELEQQGPDIHEQPIRADQQRPTKVPRGPPTGASARTDQCELPI